MPEGPLRPERSLIRRLGEIMRSNRAFLVPYLAVALLAALPCLFLTKGAIQLWINQFYSPWADLASRYVTFIGNGFFAAILVIAFAFIHFRKALILLVSFAVSGVLVQVMKRFVFPHSPRPAAFFAGVHPLHLAGGVAPLRAHSFPSGHSATAFAIFLCLAAFTKRPYQKVLCLVIACVAAFSRVYLSQHFLEDAVVGSMIGVAPTLPVLALLGAGGRTSRLDRSLRSLSQPSDSIPSPTDR